MEATDRPLLGAPGVSLPTGSFRLVPSVLPRGQVPTDISHTWDGALHAIDSQGAPYAYDRAQQTWYAIGTGIDAAARVGDTIYHFKGPEYVTSKLGVNQISAPLPIGQLSAHLPTSFQQGVCGAASLDGQLYLFAQGRYVCADQPGEVFALVDLKGWPTGSDWSGGLIDGTFSLGGDQVMVFRKGQWVTFSLSERKVSVGVPIPLTRYETFDRLPAELLGAGFRGGFTLEDGSPTAPMTLYHGPTAVVGANSTNNTPLTVVYPPTVYPGWPDSWNPQLAQAFTGRSGALWSTTKQGRLVSLSTAGFSGTTQTASAVSAGRDGSVFFVDRAATSVFALDNPSTPLYTSGVALKQLSHGRRAEVWALDANGRAVRITTPGPDAAPAARAVFQARAISANADGSVWHIGTDGQPARYIDTTGASETFPDAPAAGLVGSNSAGHGYIVSASGVGTPDTLSVHEYSSPFLFKTLGMPATSADGSVVQGGGRVFFLSQGSPWNEVIACDYESGDVIWTLPSPGQYPWGWAAYCGTLDCLVLVSTSADITVVRAADGTNYRTLAAPYSEPIKSVSVNGTLVATAAATGECNARDIESGKTMTLAGANYFSNGAAPLITGTQVFFENCGPAGTGCSISRFNREPPPYLQADFVYGDNGTAEGNYPSILVAPIIWPDLTTDEALYFVDGDGQVRAISLENPSQTVATDFLALISQGPVEITSSLSYAEGCIWFGCTIAGQRGAVVGLDTRNGLKLVPHTPFFPDVNATAVRTKPLFYRNSQDQPLVVFGTEGVAKLWAFNVTDGSVGSIDTLGTEIAALSDEAQLGIVYCSGIPPAASATTLTSYYGIRLDGIPLTSPPRYALVADSQLMQDPDQTVTGKGNADLKIPPSVARYQTHITVLDAHNVPVSNLHCKLYVDQAAASVPLMVQGQSLTVPPSGAVVATDALGKITVVSDATDLKTAALRVWAPFMDNSERVVIHPDHEFHQRVMTAHADATDTDPGKVNLVTAHNYNGNSLFTSQETDDNVPRQTASTVQQVGQAIGLGASTGASPTASSPEPATAKYVADANTGGASYYPTDTVALRPLPPPGQEFSLHVQRSADGSLAANVLSLKEAGAVLDSLGGDPWAPTALADGPVATGKLGWWWDDFWDWLCGEVEQVADVVQQVVVTVAEDVRVAVQLLVKGVQQVFHCVVKTVEDAVHAIGAFFIQLGKLVMNVIEALSVLFDFNEIILMFDVAKNLASKFLNGDPTDPATFPGLATAIGERALPAVQRFVEEGDEKISAFIDSIKEQLTGGLTMGQLKGQGATEHTIYQVTSKDGNTSQTQTVQCSWASDKMKQHLPQATMGASAALSAGTGLQGWLTDFVNTVSGGGQLAAAANQLKADFQDGFKATSVGELLVSAVDTLLDLVKLLLEAGLNIAGGLVSLTLDAVAGIVQTALDIVESPVHIPFISWLFNYLTRGELTILEAGLFLLSIPATVMFRLVTGRNPSEAFASDTSVSEDGALGAGSAATQLVFSLIGTFAGFFGGLLGALTDLGSWIDQLVKPVAYATAGFGVVGLLASFPWISSDKPDDGNIALFGLGCCALLPTLVSCAIETLPGEDDCLAVMGCAVGLASIAVYIADILIAKPSYGVDFGFAIGIGASLPAIVGLLKVNAINDFFEELGKPLAAQFEFLDALAVTFCQLVLTCQTTPYVGVAVPARGCVPSRRTGPQEPNLARLRDKLDWPLLLRMELQRGISRREQE